MRPTIPDRYPLLGAAVGIVLLLPFLVEVPKSDDLRALWYAGTFFAQGDLSNIYAVHDSAFTMRPPPAWEDLMRRRGETGALFPYLYPPIWAIIASWLADHVAFPAVVRAAAAINAVLFVGCAVLACRIVEPPRRSSAYVVLATAVSAYSTVGFTALLENQPQILVSFLILLAIERARRGADAQAGIALGIAAAIKLYPLLFVPIWLATRRWQAVGSFAATGMCLGLLSIALAGWPLHQAFLDQLAAIYGNVMVSSQTLSVPPLVAQLMARSDIAVVQAAGVGTAQNWGVLAIGGGWSLLLRAAPFAAAIAAAALFGHLRARGGDALAWPFAIGLLALFAPISWPYSYLPMFVFLPALLGRLGTARALAILALLLPPVLIPTSGLFAGLGPFFAPQQLYGTLSMIGLTLAFGALALRGPARHRGAGSGQVLRTSDDRV